MRSLAIQLRSVAFLTYFCLENIFMVTAKCPTICRMDYEPICAIRYEEKTPNHCTFLNLCILILYICQTAEQWVSVGGEVCRFHSSNCDDILLFFRNNTHLLTFEGVNKEDDDDF